MDFTQITEEQQNELKFRHLQAQLLQDTNISTIFADGPYKSLFEKYNYVLQEFRARVAHSKDNEGIERALQSYNMGVENFLDPKNAKTKEDKRILTAFAERDIYTTDSISPEIQAFSTLLTVNSNLGFNEKIETKDFFYIDTLRIKKKIDDTDAKFEKKLTDAIADDLFGETKSYFDFHMDNVTDIKNVAKMTALELAQATTPIQQHPEYNKIEDACVKFMNKYGIKQFQFDVSSSESAIDFTKNMFILDKAMSTACESLGIKESAFAVDDTSFRYYNKTNESLGTYNATTSEFSINANSLFNMQKKLLTSNESAEALDAGINSVSSTIVHEWTHLLDRKILKKVQSTQKSEGLNPQYLDSSKLFLSEFDTPAYGLHTNKKLKEAVVEFREINKVFLNGENANLARDEGAKREFMEHFWRGATNVAIDELSSKEKEKYFTENAFNAVYGYYLQPHATDNEKRFNKVMKQNDAKLLHEGFCYYDKGLDLKVPLSPDLLLTHQLMSKAISNYQQVVDTSNKSSFLTNAETLDSNQPEKKQYYSKRLEMLARYTESIFFPKNSELPEYTQVSQEDQNKVKSLYTSIIAKTFGTSMLNDETKSKFLQENPGYVEEKPKEQSKFAMATQKLLGTIKSMFGIEKEADYQLPFSKKEENIQIILELPDKKASKTLGNEHKTSQSFSPT